jgi:hypothetical protein
MQAEFVAKLEKFLHSILCGGRTIARPLRPVAAAPSPIAMLGRLSLSRLTHLLVGRRDCEPQLLRCGGTRQGRRRWRSRCRGRRPGASIAGVRVILVLTLPLPLTSIAFQPRALNIFTAVNYD